LALNAQGMCNPIHSLSKHCANENTIVILRHEKVVYKEQTRCKDDLGFGT